MKSDCFSKMKISFLKILALILISLNSLHAGEVQNVSAYMVCEAFRPWVEGESFTVMVVLDLEPGWHTYWSHPGDFGIPTKVEWHLPKGWIAGPTECSIPQLISEPAGMIIYGYEKHQLLRTLITPPRNLPKDQLYELKASVFWLASNGSSVPGSDEVSCEISGPSNRLIRWLSSCVAEGEWPEAAAPPFQVSLSGKGETKIVSFTGHGGATYELYPDPAKGIGMGTTAGHVVPKSSGSSWNFTIPWDGPAPFHGLLVERLGDVRRAWWVGGRNQQ